MISAETAGRNSTSVAWTNTGLANPQTRTFNTGSVRNMALRGLNLTGSQLLVGCIGFVCATGLVLWAVLKLWLFEP
jgi:hypothetical protein